jgi:hypothetical protein
MSMEMENRLMQCSNRVGICYVGLRRRWDGVYVASAAIMKEIAW